MQHHKIKELNELFELVTHGTVSHVIVPSKRTAFMLNRMLIDRLGDSSLLDGIFTTCEEYLQSRTQPIFPKIDKISKKLLVFEALKSIEPSYFRSASRGVLDALCNAISALKTNRISPKELASIASTRGNKKEFDLLCVYKKYEELLSQKGLFDEETIYLTDLSIGASELDKIALFGFNHVPPVIEHFFGKASTIEIRKEARPVKEIVAYNSPISEARGVIERIADALQKKIPQDEIFLVLQDRSFLWNILIALREANIVEEDTLPFDPCVSDIAIKIFGHHFERETATAREFAETLLELLSNESKRIFDSIGLAENPATRARILLSFDTAKNALERLCQDFIVSRSEFRSLFEQIVGGLTIDETKLPFKIVTLEEAAIFDAKLKIIVQCNDGVIPAQTGHLKFFSEPDTHKLERIFLPTDKELLIEQKLFDAAKSDAYLTLSIHTSDGSECSISPFLADTKPPLIANKTAQRYGNDRILGEDFTDGTAIALLQSNIRARTNDPSSHRPFSITKLENYGRCPFQYFCRNILEITPPDDRSGGILPKDRGTLVHVALEYFFKEHREQLNELLTHHDSSHEKIKQLANEAIDYAMAENNSITASYDTNIIERFNKRARHLIVEVILKEVEYLSNCSERPVHFEETLSWENFAIEGLSIMGVVDRVDCDDSTFSILDYKTGLTENVETKIQKGLHLQLPLYAIMAKHIVGNLQPAGLFLYAVRDFSRKHGLVDKELAAHCVGKNKISRNMLVDSEKMQLLIDEAVDHAQNYVRRVFEGKFSGEPKDADCRRSCDFRDACHFID